MSSPQNGHDNEKPAGCPPLEILRRAAQGQAASEVGAMVERHLNQCSACRHRYDEILQGTEGVAELRNVAGGNAEADLAAIRAAGFPRFPQRKSPTARCSYPTASAWACPATHGTWPDWEHTMCSR